MENKKNLNNQNIPNTPLLPTSFPDSSLLNLLGRRTREKILTELDDTDFIWLRHQENQLDLLLYISYLEARKGGKRKTHDEHLFELNDLTNLATLKQNLLDRTYKPSRSAAHIVHKPVIREIFAAPFRDRIVHHLLFNAVYEWWDNHFIHDSYSCREEKGVLFGIRRLEHHIRSVAQNSHKSVYVLKLDIQGYFMSLPRQKLYERAIWGLDRQFKGHTDSSLYRVLKYLWREIIFDDPVQGATKKGRLSDWDLLPRSKSLFFQPYGLGIVIGNLTSQLLSNIYLDQLDQFVTKVLGYKHYGRYVDDFYIVVSKSQLPQLKKDIKVIENFLKSINLTLHPKKRMLRKASDGIPFLGAIVHLNHTTPGHRLIKNMERACREIEAGERDLSSLPSYLGHTKHLNSYNAVKEIFHKLSWGYNSSKSRPHYKQK